MDIQNPRLEGRSLSQLQDFEALIVKIKSEPPTNQLIKELSVKFNIIKSYCSEVRWNQLHEKDKEYISHLRKEAWGILEPIYDALTKMAVEHCHQWYQRLKTSAGEVDPYLYDYQLDLINWILEAIIKAELPEEIYTLLVSRGSGKSYSLSIVALFLSIFWDTYILHIKQTDMVSCISAPTEKQLSGFRGYIQEFINIAIAEGIIAELDSQASETGLFISRYNTNEIVLTNSTSGAKHCTIYFRLGASSIEGLHNNILYCDEIKFLSKHALQTSMLPTVGARSGVFVGLSSAHDEWCIFQDIVEKNMRKDEQDHYEHGTRLIKSGSVETKNLNWNGRLHYQQHWKKMCNSNYQYAMAVQRALNAVDGNEDEPSFATQYNNLFLSVKTASFFDIEQLNKQGSFQHILEYSYIRNGQYILVAGWDVAVSGIDNSVLTIKAIPNGHGSNREAKLIKMFVLNPKRDRVSENVKAQAEKVGRLIMEYGISSIAIDCTAIGNSADIYLKDFLKSQGYRDLKHENIFAVNINSKTRFEILENYYQRIQSKLEIFPKVDMGLSDDDYNRRAYGKAWDKYTDENIETLFFTEHQRFNRLETKDEKTGEIKIQYAQENARWLHDDWVFGSGLSSYCLYLNPFISKSLPVKNGNSAPYVATRNRSWR